MRWTATGLAEILTMMVQGRRGRRELTICGVLMLVGRAVASVIRASDVAVVVVHTVVRGWRVLWWEVLIGVLNGVTLK